MKQLKHCLALDLQDDEKLISEYEYYHRPENIWPEIVAGIKECNILNMEIYRCGDRLFMILEVNEKFDLKTDFEKMSVLPKQKEWTSLMGKFQKKLPFSKPDELWVSMNKIFDLNL